MMRSGSWTSPFSSWRRALVALLAGTGLAFGAIAPHDPLTERPGVPVGVEIEENAVHPNAPTHIESSHAEVHPPCQACLLQIQTQSIQPRPAAVLSRPDDEVAVSLLSETVLSASVPRFGPPRAPPARLA
jgi:hypothetical protein